MRFLLILLLAGAAAWFAPAPLSRAHGTIEIAAPRDRVWTILAELTSTRLWDPVMKDVRLASEIKSGLGAIRASGGPVVRTNETVTEWVTYNRLVFQVSHDPDLTQFETSTLALSPGRPSGTRLEWAIDYQMNGGYIGWLADRVLFGSMHQGRIHQGLANLRRYAETGEPAY